MLKIEKAYRNLHKPKKVQRKTDAALKIAELIYNKKGCVSSGTLFHSY